MAPAKQDAGPGRLPEPGEVVWCNFPSTYIERFTKERPVLVIASGSEPDGRMLVTVCYGTTQHLTPIGPACFVVSTPKDIAACGLRKATKFDLNTYTVLEWTTEYFPTPVAPGVTATSPHMGAIPKSLLEDLKAAYTRSRYKAYREQCAKGR